MVVLGFQVATGPSGLNSGASMLSWHDVAMPRDAMAIIPHNNDLYSFMSLEIQFSYYWTLILSTHQVA